MRPVHGLLLPFVLASALSAGGAAQAQLGTTGDSPAELQGLWLTTDYPSITERLGEDIRLNLSLQNRNLPPQRVELSVDGLPDGWSWEIQGAGKPVTAAIVQPDKSQSLTLELTPPDNAATGDISFTVTAKGDAQALTLPVSMSLSEAEAAQVKLEPKLPALRGTPKSTFDFQVKVTNDSPDDQVFNLLADAPAGFQTTFKEQYGSQELTSIPLKANESKDITLSVKLPQQAAAGQYQVMARVGSATVNAETPLVLDVTGQPTLALSGPEGRLSGDATAGQERSFKFTLENTGTAPAENVAFNASSPNGWKVTFSPETIPSLEAGQQAEITVGMTPSEQAIAGDYVVSVRANGDGASADANFRVTVLTSTMWGIAGLGVIGAALIVLAFAVTRYGRR